MNIKNNILNFIDIYFTKKQDSIEIYSANFYLFLNKKN